MKDIDRVEAVVGSYIVRVALQGDSAGFDYDTDLIAIAAIDSLTVVELFEFLESSFEIEISPDEVNPENLVSIRAIAAMVRRLSRSSASADPEQRVEVNASTRPVSP